MCFTCNFSESWIFFNNLIDNPITAEEVKRNKELAELKVGNQGTNFSATKKEYNQILEMANNKNIPIEVRVVYAYLVKSMSHRNIQKEILFRRVYDIEQKVRKKDA